MNDNVKTGKENPALDAACEMFTNSLQTMFNMQKSVLDLAVQQNAETAEAYKKVLKGTAFAPSSSVVDFATQAFEKYAGLQKSFLDLAFDQANALTQFPGLRQESPAKTGNMLTNLMQESIQRGVTAQKMALDVASQQNKALTDVLKQQLSGTPMAAAADSIQRGVDALIETQKNVLEIASKPLKTTAAVA